MLDQISHLFRLQAIIEEGSMRKAAGRLGVTQPALTRSIALLEARFGKPLLLRNARGVTATEFGAKVVYSVSRLSRQWELSEAELLDGGSGTTGVLRLRAGPLWRAVALPRLIPLLQDHFPSLTVVIESNSTRSAVSDLGEGRIDVVFGGVQMGSSEAPHLGRRQFTTVQDRVIAREGHPVLSQIATKGPAAVLDFPWIVYTADPVYELETVHGSIERFGREPKISVRTESLITTLALLQNSDYLCMLPHASVFGTSKPGLVPVPIALGNRTINSGAMFRLEIEDWPPLVKLLDLCMEYASVHFPAD